MARPLTEQGPLGNARSEGILVKNARTRAARLREALRWVLSDVRGQLYLADLVVQSQTLLSIPGAPTDEAAHHWIGRRSMGLRILEDVESLDKQFHRPLAALLSAVLTTPTEANNGRRTGDGIDGDPDSDDDPDGSS